MYIPQKFQYYVFIPLKSIITYLSLQIIETHIFVQSIYLTLIFYVFPFYPSFIFPSKATVLENSIKSYQYQYWTVLYQYQHWTVPVPKLKSRDEERWGESSREEPGDYVSVFGEKRRDVLALSRLNRLKGERKKGYSGHYNIN